jgi:hypothetical protein
MRLESERGKGEEIEEWRSELKRGIRRILACLLLGAITSIAVAWAFACLPHFTARARWTGVVDGVGCYSEQLANAGSTWLITDEVIPSPHLASRPELAERILAFEMILFATTFDPQAEEIDQSFTPVRPRMPAIEGAIVVEYRHGWPMRALTCHAILSPDDLPRIFEAAPVRKYDDPNEFLGSRMLPLRPIWDGQLLNTLFFAGAWIVFFIAVMPAVRGARGFFRAKRGRCPRCGYDLRGHKVNSPHPNPLPEGDGAWAGCPECGWRRE